MDCGRSYKVLQFVADQPTIKQQHRPPISEDNQTTNAFPKANPLLRTIQ